MMAIRRGMPKRRPSPFKKPRYAVKTRKPTKASLTQILLCYDQPEILLLKISAKEYVLAVASPVDFNEFGFGPYFVGASVTLKNLRDYQDEKCDLRFMLSSASYGRYWKFSFDSFDSSIDLNRCSLSDEGVVEAFPDGGFFARSHERIQLVTEFVPDVSEQFEIDGGWDLGEFSSFYGKMEDIYYIANDLRRFRAGSTSASDRRVISEAMQKPWRGGGSYVSFYKDIANDNAPTARLKVGGIAYNSPGHVRVKAKRVPFEDMISMIRLYSKNATESKIAYNKLHKYLGMHSLLQASADTMVRPAISEQIEIYGEEISQIHSGISFNLLKQMAAGNVLVAAKVQLSILRRIERLCEFFEQGRVAYAGLEVDPLKHTARPDR